MLKIRLRRTGKRNQSSYRIVVVEARSKRNGQYVESLGFWHVSSGKIKIDKKKYLFWQERGAQPTEAVRKLYEKAS